MISISIWAHLNWYRFQSKDFNIHGYVNIKIWYLCRNKYTVNTDKYYIIYGMPHIRNPISVFPSAYLYFTFSTPMDYLLCLPAKTRMECFISSVEVSLSVSLHECLISLLHQSKNNSKMCPCITFSRSVAWSWLLYIHTLSRLYSLEG